MEVLVAPALRWRAIAARIMVWSEVVIPTKPHTCLNMTFCTLPKAVIYRVVEFIRNDGQMHCKRNQRDDERSAQQNEKDLLTNTRSLFMASLFSKIFGAKKEEEVPITKQIPEHPDSVADFGYEWKGVLPPPTLYSPHLST